MGGAVIERRSFLWSVSAFLVAPPLVRSNAISAVTNYELVSGGHIGLYAENLRTGRKLAWRSAERFLMCSTFKASLAACILSQVDGGQMRLGDVISFGASDVPDWHAPVARANLGKGHLTVAEMCKAAVELSDNTCANLLLARIGGPAGLTAFWRRLGDDVSRLDDPEPYLNRTPLGGIRDTTTPTAMAQTLRILVLGRALSQASRTLLVEWLTGCKTGDNRLRAGLPKAWVIGDKTGNNGNDAAGDIAVVWPEPAIPIVIAVYTRGGSPTEPQLDAVFAGIGHAVAAQLI